MIETSISLFLCLLVAIHIFLQPSRQCLFEEEGVYWSVLATRICAFLFLLQILEVWLAAFKVDAHGAVYQPLKLL